MNRYSTNKHSAENALRESLNEERGCQKRILNESGNAYSAGRYLYSQIKKLEENVIASHVNEGVEFVFGQENKGGMVIFSTDVNAISNGKGIIGVLKNWAKTFFNRMTANKRLNDIAEKYSPEGWTVGRFLRGRYKARNGKVFDENSISLEIIGLDTDQMIALAEELCAEFGQETVLLKDYTSKDVMLISADKEAISEAKSSKKIAWIDMINKMEELGYDYTGDYNFVPPGYKTKYPLYRFDYNHKQGTEKLSVQQIKDEFDGNVTILVGSSIHAPEMSYILMTNRVFDPQKAISESSISRIYSLITREDCVFGIVSAFRKDLSNNMAEQAEFNEERHSELKNTVRKMGYGYVELRGAYKEEGYNGVDIFEKSLIIGKITREEIIALGKEYDQDSVIWHGDGKFELIESDGSVSNFAKDSMEVVEETIDELKDLAEKNPEKFKKLFIVGSWLKRGTQSARGKKLSFIFEARMNPSVNRGMIEKKFGAEKTWKDRFEFELNESEEEPDLKEDILSHINQDYGENLAYDAILYYYYNDDDEWNPWRGEKDLYVQNRVDTKEKAEEVEAAVNDYMMDHEHEWINIENGDRGSVLKFYKELVSFIDSKIN